MYHILSNVYKIYLKLFFVAAGLFLLSGLNYAHNTDRCSASEKCIQK